MPQCDQLKYETSSNVLDLRYVSDDTTFTNTPKESCDSVPDRYKPTIFAILALQQTDVKLTWKEDDDQRLELLTRSADWKDAHDDDFKAYLALDVSDAFKNENESDTSDEEKQVDNNTTVITPDSSKETKEGAKIKKLRTRYRSMLLGSDAEDEDDTDACKGDLAESIHGDEGVDDEGDMDILFAPGAGDVLKAKRQKKLKAANLLREAITVGGDSSNGESSDADHVARNFDMKKIAKQKKVKSLKGKRRAKEKKKLMKQRASGGLQEGFEFDAADPHIDALYSKGSQSNWTRRTPSLKKQRLRRLFFRSGGNDTTRTLLVPCLSRWMQILLETTKTTAR